MSTETGSGKAMLTEWRPRGAPGARRYFMHEGDEYAGVVVRIGRGDEWEWFVNATGTEPSIVACHDRKVQILDEETARAAADEAARQWYRLPEDLVAPSPPPVPAVGDGWACICGAWNSRRNTCRRCGAIASPSGAPACEHPTGYGCSACYKMHPAFTGRCNCICHGDAIPSPGATVPDATGAEVPEDVQRLLRTFNEARRRYGLIGDGMDWQADIGARAAVEKMARELATTKRRWGQSDKISDDVIAELMTERDRLKADLATATAALSDIAEGMNDGDTSDPMHFALKVRERLLGADVESGELAAANSNHANAVEVFHREAEAHRQTQLERDGLAAALAAATQERDAAGERERAARNTALLEAADILGERSRHQRHSGGGMGSGADAENEMNRIACDTLDEAVDEIRALAAPSDAVKS